MSPFYNLNIVGLIGQGTSAAKTGNIFGYGDGSSIYATGTTMEHLQNSNDKEMDNGYFNVDPGLDYDNKRSTWTKTTAYKYYEA